MTSPGLARDQESAGGALCFVGGLAPVRRRRRSAGLARALEPLAASFVPHGPSVVERFGFETGVLLEVAVAVHEAAHATVGVVCGDIVERVHMTTETASGACHSWSRQELTAGAIIARLAVLLAGQAGAARATGDTFAAELQAKHDQDDVVQLLAASGLGDKHVEDALRIAARIVAMVLDACWSSVTAIAERLLYGSGHLDGAEVHALVQAPAELQAAVRSLVA